MLFPLFFVQLTLSQKTIVLDKLEITLVLLKIIHLCPHSLQGPEITAATNPLDKFPPKTSNFFVLWFKKADYFCPRSLATVPIYLH